MGGISEDIREWWVWNMVNKGRMEMDLDNICYFSWACQRSSSIPAPPWTVSWETEQRHELVPITFGWLVGLCSIGDWTMALPGFMSVWHSLLLSLKHSHALGCFSTKTLSLWLRRNLCFLKYLLLPPAHCIQTPVHAFMVASLCPRGPSISKHSTWPTGWWHHNNRGPSA